MTEPSVSDGAKTTAASTERRRWFPRRSRADVQLVGRVGAEPDIRFAGEGGDRAWARFSVATESPDAERGAPDWHSVVARDRLAQYLARYLTKGRLVHVVGRLTYRPIEGRQCAHRVAEIHASEVLILDRPPQPDSRSTNG